MKTAPRFLIPLRASIVRLLIPLTLAMWTSYATFDRLWADDTIGFVERYALAGDREAALGELIAGTEEYAWFHALHYEQTGQWQRQQQVLDNWEQRQPNSDLVEFFTLRRALIQHEDNPERTLELLTEALNLRFDHQRDAADRERDLPTELDQNLIGWEAMLQQAAGSGGVVRGLHDRGLERLLREGVELPAGQRRELLARLQSPDLPGLVELVVADLASQQSGGFGEFPIHQRLFEAQLVELAGQRPQVLREAAYVAARLQRMQPGPDRRWQSVPAEKLAYLRRAWEFVAGLEPLHNPVKVDVLYQKLDAMRALGQRDEELFLEYLRLPRLVPYMRPEYLSDPARRGAVVQLGSHDHSAAIGLPIIPGDEELVRDYLLHFLREGADGEAYAPYLREDYLRRAIAEARLLAGEGDPERWFSALGAAAAAQLRDRVDIDFDPANAIRFGVDQVVSLDLWLKNTDELTVKVYEINTPGHYRETGEPVTTALDLDGLVANIEQRHPAPEGSAFIRERRRFDFPELQGKRGVWVIEFIGNGRSSRALIHKGRLDYLAEPSPAGVLLRIIDEQGRHLPEATAWIGGREFGPDDEGLVLIPFSTDPGPKPLVLQADGFASLDTLDHPAEDYQLHAGFHVEREQLIRRETATVVIRPTLTVNGAPVAISVLEDPALTLLATDHDGVQSTERIEGLTLSDDGELEHSFLVPERLASMQLVVEGRVRRLTGGGHADVSAAAALAINGIDRAQTTRALHLTRDASGFGIELLGKAGEPLAGRAVRVSLNHRDFQQPRHVTLKTGDDGRIALGELAELTRVEAAADGAGTAQWRLPADRARRPAVIHAVAGDDIAVPYLGEAGEVTAAEVALHDLRSAAERPGSDLIEHIELRDGYYVISGLEPGDYHLHLRPDDAVVRLRVDQGESLHGHLLADDRQLQLARLAPLQITDIETGDEHVEIRLANAGALARVHVFGARYVPERTPFGALSGFPLAEPAAAQPSRWHNSYVSGRSIGDEYRYILDRRSGTARPGNMLPRASLLLNPWAVRDTETGEQEAEAGEMHSERMDGEAERRQRREADTPSPDEVAAGQVNLDFIATAAPVLLNLEPDEDGIVRVPVELLAGHPHLRVLATDPEQMVSRHLNLAPVELERRELRLVNGLEPGESFAERDQVTVLAAGDALRIEDVASSRFERLDSLAKVYRLFQALGEDEKLEDFRFLLRWSEMERAEQLEKYSEFASHELSFFLQRRDPEFFAEVIQPYLANKRHKDFIDHYLLGDDLEPYLEPYAFGRLNIIERILLARRLGGEAQDRVARAVDDDFSLLPPDPEGDTRLFESVLASASMASGDEARELARLALEEKAADPGDRGLRFGAAMPPGAPPPAAAPPAEGAALGGVAARRLQQYDEADAAAMPAAEAVLMDEAAEAPVPGLRRRAADREPADHFRADDQRRQVVEALYRRPDDTKEWAENQYYKLEIHEQGPDLVELNAFWRDFATWDGEGGFHSAHVARATGNLTEMLFALAVLDLPERAGDHEVEIDGAALVITAASPVILFHREVLPVEDADEAGASLLVSQDFFDVNDRYQMIDNEQVDKFVTGEFLAGRVYGCQVVVTNPGSSVRRVEVLTQIPRGALPVGGSRETASRHLRLDPFTTVRLEYFFYFPEAIGEAAHYPVQVTHDGSSLAAADAFTFDVVDELSEIDTTSWDYVSQWGDNDDVIAYLNDNNLGRIDLSRVAWRAREDAAFHQQLIDLLSLRQHYSQVLWSYGLHHGQPEVARQFLLHQDELVEELGPWLRSPLLDIDPIERGLYQHLEYSPLVNARAHRLGTDRRVLNEVFHGQYHEAMTVLAMKPELDSTDHLAASYYLLLQDRVDEGLAHFAMVDADQLAERLQHDYLACYVAFYENDVDRARQIANRHVAHPVKRWRDRFAQVIAQVGEIDGAEVVAEDADDRDRRQEELAARTPSFEFEIEGSEVIVRYANLTELEVNYYEMDLEFLFSSQPFVAGAGGRFSVIKPNTSARIALPADTDVHRFPLPDAYRNANVLVELTGAGRTRSSAYYANSMRVIMSEDYGQLQVVGANDGRPLPKTYVKVYARFNDGSEGFYKDGYTDLRGRFDYSSLSTDNLDQVDRFSILIMSEQNGAVVKEASAPVR